MDSNLDLMKAYFDAAWANPPGSITEAAENYLSDDFQNFDHEGNVVMNKESFIGMGQLMYAAFKDYKYVYSDIRAEGDDVIVSGHFEGTHTGDLDLSAMGLGVVPASGKHIVFPEASNKWKVEGDKIVSIQDVTAAAGIEAFLAALGVEPPSA